MSDSRQEYVLGYNYAAQIMRDNKNKSLDIIVEGLWYVANKMILVNEMKFKYLGVLDAVREYESTRVVPALIDH